MRTLLLFSAISFAAYTAPSKERLSLYADKIKSVQDTYDGLKKRLKNDIFVDYFKDDQSLSEVAKQLDYVIFDTYGDVLKEMAQCQKVTEAIKKKCGADAKDADICHDKVLFEATLNFIHTYNDLAYNPVNSSVGCELYDFTTAEKNRQEYLTEVQKVLQQEFEFVARNLSNNLRNAFNRMADHETLLQSTFLKGLGGKISLKGVTVVPTNLEKEGGNTLLLEFVAKRGPSRAGHQASNNRNNIPASVEETIVKVIYKPQSFLLDWLVTGNTRDFCPLNSSATPFADDSQQITTLCRLLMGVSTQTDNGFAGKSTQYKVNSVQTSSSSLGSLFEIFNPIQPSGSNQGSTKLLNSLPVFKILPIDNQISSFVKDAAPSQKGLNLNVLNPNNPGHQNEVGNRILNAYGYMQLDQDTFRRNEIIQAIINAYESNGSETMVEKFDKTLLHKLLAEYKIQDTELSELFHVAGKISEIKQIASSVNIKWSHLLINSEINWELVANSGNNPFKELKYDSKANRIVFKNDDAKKESRDQSSSISDEAVNDDILTKNQSFFDEGRQSINEGFCSLESDSKASLAKQSKVQKWLDSEIFKAVTTKEYPLKVETVSWLQKNYKASLRRYFAGLTVRMTAAKSAITKFKMLSAKRPIRQNNVLDDSDVENVLAELRMNALSLINQVKEFWKGSEAFYTSNSRLLVSNGSLFDLAILNKVIMSIGWEDHHFNNPQSASAKENFPATQSQLMAEANTLIAVPKYQGNFNVDSVGKFLLKLEHSAKTYTEFRCRQSKGETTPDFASILSSHPQKKISDILEAGKELNDDNISTNGSEIDSSDCEKSNAAFDSAIHQLFADFSTLKYNEEAFNHDFKNQFDGFFEFWENKKATVKSKRPELIEIQEIFDKRRKENTTKDPNFISNFRQDVRNLIFQSTRLERTFQDMDSARFDFADGILELIRGQTESEAEAAADPIPKQQLMLLLTDLVTPILQGFIPAFNTMWPLKFLYTFDRKALYFKEIPRKEPTGSPILDIIQRDFIDKKLPESENNWETVIELKELIKNQFKGISKNDSDYFEISLLEMAKEQLAQKMTQDCGSNDRRRMILLI